MNCCMYIQLYALYIETCITSNMYKQLYALYIEERQGIWNPIHLVHVGTYRYVPTCTDLYYDIVCTGTYYLKNVA